MRLRPQKATAPQKHHFLYNIDRLSALKEAARPLGAQGSVFPVIANAERLHDDGSEVDGSALLMCSGHNCRSASNERSAR